MSISKKYCNSVPSVPVSLLFILYIKAGRNRLLQIKASMIFVLTSLALAFIGTEGQIRSNNLPLNVCGLNPIM